MPGTTSHTWKFFRIGGLDQVAVQNGADLLALKNLDQKLWVALSCPVKGLALDEKTLALIDTDNDGHIRAPDLLAAIDWAAPHLKDAGDLLKGSDQLPVDSLDDKTPEGAAVLASARAILRDLGKADASAITLAEAANTAGLLAATPFNGDGVIDPETTADETVRQVIADIIATTGGVPDCSGKTGVDQAKVDAFFAAATACSDWLAKGSSPEILSLGAATSAAHAAVAAVRAKVDDYFARSRLAAYDPASLPSLNRSEADYLPYTSKDLSADAREVSAFPLAHVSAGQPLPLLANVNPAWADALATFHRDAVTPILGAPKIQLAEADWTAIRQKLAAYDTWLASKATGPVESLGPDRIKALLAGDARATLNALLAQDLARAPEFKAINNLERLIRYRRDFRVLLRNFVNFFDFYSPDRSAVFQAGVLYLDNRSTELCIEVAGPSPLAAMSKLYIAYCACTRPGLPPKTIAACFTQGDSDYLFVGRNGLFYDRQGRDWDATITGIADAPISIRQAFFSPYKKFVRLIGEQIAKRAGAAQAKTDESLSATAAGAPPAATQKLDVGTIAAISIAFGAIGTFLTTFVGYATGVISKGPLMISVAILGIVLLISLPSMIMAAIKLSQRTLGPILDANGWAINGRVKISIPFGTRLTSRAQIPAGAKLDLSDPYADKEAIRRRRAIITFIVLAAIIVAAWWINTHGGIFQKKPAADSTKPAPADASKSAPAPAKP